MWACNGVEVVRCGKDKVRIAEMHRIAEIAEITAAAKKNRHMLRPSHL